jgi:aryl-alcohol dehydrogenase-like predicted oxidoreductase
MKYTKLGKSDLNVSAIGQGTWAMGGDFYGETDEKEMISTIHAAVDAGINFIDTAPAYGNGRAQSIVGKAVKNMRDKVIIGDKCGIVWNGKGMERILKATTILLEVERTLRVLGTDYIDLYQVHWPDLLGTPLEETFGALNLLVEQGKVRYIGVSNFDLDQLKKTVSLTNLIAFQPQYSMLARGAEEDVIPFCRENNIGVITWGSLAAGMLTGEYKEAPKAEKDNRSKFYEFFNEPYLSKSLELVEYLKTIASNYGKALPQVAINWVINQPGISVALCGGTTPKMAQENAAAADWDLSKDDINSIEAEYFRIFGNDKSMNQKHWKTLD